MESLPIGSTDLDPELLDDESGCVCNDQPNIAQFDEVPNAQQIMVMSYNASRAKRMKQRSLNKTKSVFFLIWQKRRKLAKKFTKQKLS